MTMTSITPMKRERQPLAEVPLYLRMPPIFCCPHPSLIPLSLVRTPVQHRLWNFTFFSSSSASPPLTASPRFLPFHLKQASYCIQLEQWVHGYKVRQRYFIPHPLQLSPYIEVPHSSIESQIFLRTWQEIKVRCGSSHKHNLYVLKYLERGEEEKKCEAISLRMRDKILANAESDGQLKEGDMAGKVKSDEKGEDMWWTGNGAAYVYPEDEYGDPDGRVEVRNLFGRDLEVMGEPRKENEISDRGEEIDSMDVNKPRVEEGLAGENGELYFDA
ncbi:hypothetical protein B0O99DRAFT_738541 [Bisporella sp. PMI_857]|nr:hypothetical protein B0O99DRAFT_738541 [Bisporella sp. PMI_857]